MLKTLMPRMLNRKAEKSNPDLIFNVLGDLTGKIIGDIGSGGGLFTLKFAQAVGPAGKVFAIDKSRENLAYIRDFAHGKGLSNIETVWSKEDEIPLAPACVDLFFSRNSFHHIPEPERYFNRLRAQLKPRGRLVIIDYKKSSGFTFITLFGHCADETDIKNALKKGGYLHLSSHDILKGQSFNIFEKK